MRIVSWNMNRVGRSASSHRDAWAYLKHELKADLALVQEASPPEDLKGQVYVPIGEKRYAWGSALVPFRDDMVLEPYHRVPLAQSEAGALKKRELPESHRGASAVADVLVKERVLFTAVSLYGQWEMMPGSTNYLAGRRLHRLLSDLTGVLARSRRSPVVLAGDFNVTTQGAKSKGSARLRAWRLVDCIAHTRHLRPRVPNCACPDGEACSHVPTLQAGTQFDYAFLSDSILLALGDCSVLGKDEAWQRSDHCPIVLDLDEDALVRRAPKTA